MFEEFLLNSFVTTRVEVPLDARKFYGGELGTLLDHLGGATIDHGLYRVHTQESSIKWTQIIERYIPDFKGRVVPFGFDWLGRQYALDRARKNYILMFDPATIEAFEFQQSIVGFHNSDLCEDDSSPLARSFFGEILKALKLNEILYSDCIGHNIPLFMGGSDIEDNFELIDMEVHWDIQNQLFEQVKNLPPGTEINKVEFLKGRKK